jgi:hypothetical protein
LPQISQERGDFCCTEILSRGLVLVNNITLVLRLLFSLRMTVASGAFYPVSSSAKLLFLRQIRQICISRVAIRGERLRTPLWHRRGNKFLWSEGTVFLQPFATLSRIMDVVSEKCSLSLWIRQQPKRRAAAKITGCDVRLGVTDILHFFAPQRSTKYCACVLMHCQQFYGADPAVKWIYRNRVKYRSKFSCKWITLPQQNPYIFLAPKIRVLNVKLLQGHIVGVPAVWSISSESTCYV